MSRLMKYLLFTFISAWIFGGIAVYNASLGGTLALCMFMPMLGALLVKADIKEMGWILRFGQNWKYIAIAYFAPTVFQFIGAAFYFLVFPDDFSPSEAFQRFMPPEEYEEFVQNGSPYISVIAEEILEDLNPFFMLVPVFWHLARRQAGEASCTPSLKMATAGQRDSLSAE